MSTITASSNRQFRLAARPHGMVKATDWELTTSALEHPGPSQVLVKVDVLSVDPAMRSWMNAGKSYVEPVEIGEVMRAAGAGYVVESQDPRFQPGDAVLGRLCVQEYALVDGSELEKVDTSDTALSAYLNLLGYPGMTAYFGLLEVGRVKAGETVLVSAAAGAVGSAVGQLAKIAGCRVIGLAGGPAKCKHLLENLGFDAAIDYKAGDVRKAIAKAAPRGVDVYFDNVGGDILDIALTRLRRGARVVVCGQISQYNSTERAPGPANYMALLMNRARMEGFVVFDYVARFPEAMEPMRRWMREGKLKSQEDVVEGLERFPEAVQRLFEGANTGKVLLKLTETRGA